jgi:hypothetical protein
MVFDRTCAGPRVLKGRANSPRWPGLTWSWEVGAKLYQGLGRLDACFGAASWSEALAWLAHVEPGRRIGEIQFWGHGRWGDARIGRERLSIEALQADQPHNDALQAIRARLVGPKALWWFRTCETFGKAEGHAFATAWTRFFQCRAAGHTYVIGPFQSGLHSLGPSDVPSWSIAEGVQPGAPDASVALWSTPTAPNTITCLTGSIPRGF